MEDEIRGLITKYKARIANNRVYLDSAMKNGDIGGFPPSNMLRAKENIYCEILNDLEELLANEDRCGV